MPVSFPTHVQAAVPLGIACIKTAADVDPPEQPLRKYPAAQVPVVVVQLEAAAFEHVLDTVVDADSPAAVHQSSIQSCPPPTVFALDLMFQYQHCLQLDLGAVDTSHLGR